MTEMLKEYLDFCKKNYPGLKYASEYAEEDCFFEFYYDGATDSVHVHYDNGMEVEMNYDDVEEFESAKNDLVQELVQVVENLPAYCTMKKKYGFFAALLNAAKDVNSSLEKH